MSDRVPLDNDSDGSNGKGLDLLMRTRFVETGGFAWMHRMDKI